MTANQPDSDRFDGPLRFRRREAGGSRASAGGEPSGLWAWFEWGSLIYALLIFCGISLFGQDPDPTALQESNPIAFFSNLFILAMFGLLVFFNRRKSADF